MQLMAVFGHQSPSDPSTSRPAVYDAYNDSHHRHGVTAPVNSAVHFSSTASPDDGDNDHQHRQQPAIDRLVVIPVSSSSSSDSTPSQPAVSTAEPLISSAAAVLPVSTTHQPSPPVCMIDAMPLMWVPSEGRITG